MVFIYVVANFGQIITSQLNNQTAYMLALQACPAAQLQPSSFEGWCPFSIPVIISPHLLSYNMPPVYS